jgi:hypothetical protein
VRKGDIENREERIDGKRRDAPFRKKPCSVLLVPLLMEFPLGS